MANGAWWPSNSNRNTTGALFFSFFLSSILNFEYCCLHNLTNYIHNTHCWSKVQFSRDVIVHSHGLGSWQQRASDGREGRRRMNTMKLFYFILIWFVSISREKNLLFSVSKEPWVTACSSRACVQVQLCTWCSKHSRWAVATAAALRFCYIAHMNMMEKYAKWNIHNWKNLFAPWVGAQYSRTSRNDTFSIKSIFSSRKKYMHEQLSHGKFICVKKRDLHWIYNNWITINNNDMILLDNINRLS